MHPKARLQQDLKEAMRAGDALRKTVIRMGLSAIKNAEIAKGGDLTAEEATHVLNKEAKKRREAIRDYEHAGRTDQAEQERAELGVLEAYLPKQLTREEIAAEARAVIEETGASGKGDMGKVMGTLMGRLKGRADGKVVNQVVKELLI